MRLRWFSVFSCLLAAMALGFTACGDDDDDDGGGGGGEFGDTATIYSSLPLQGANRPQTTAMVQGMELALEQAGGKVGDLTIEYVSTGVPSTTNTLGLTSRMRSGRWSEMAWELALCSASGAATHTSPRSATAGSTTAGRSRRVCPTSAW